MAGLSAMGGPLLHGAAWNVGKIPAHPYIIAWLDVVVGRKRRKQPLCEGETAETHGL